MSRRDFITCGRLAAIGRCPPSSVTHVAHLRSTCEVVGVPDETGRDPGFA
jgi:hypothetical protein